ncbi:hypothetical protein [Xanthomonas campestris]|uniref:hypothetical protein n=1 Tax=Xanthomonas campestris TaxID=339 RepID=UPI00388EEFEE
MTAEFFCVGCIAHHQRLALSHSCSCSNRSSAQLITTPATSLQSLQIPRVDPPIALPASFSKRLNVHNRLQMAVTLPLPACHRHFPSITKRGICSQRHELRGSARQWLSITNPGICLPTTNDQRPTASDRSLVICLPVVSRYELWELSASGRPS